MTLTTLINRPCTITHRTWDGAADRYGSKLPVETDVVTVCELQQRQRNERDDAGETIDSSWLLVLLPETVIAAGDTVSVVGDGEFEVHGEPWVSRNPRTQIVSHIEATVKRAAGTSLAGAS